MLITLELIKTRNYCDWIFFVLKYFLCLKLTTNGYYTGRRHRLFLYGQISSSQCSCTPWTIRFGVWQNRLATLNNTGFIKRLTRDILYTNCSGTLYMFNKHVRHPCTGSAARSWVIVFYFYDGFFDNKLSKVWQSSGITTGSVVHLRIWKKNMYVSGSAN